MYKLPIHQETDRSVLYAFIASHPFAFISGSDVHYRPVVTQAPLLLERRNGCDVLTGHLMRKTDHHKAFETNPEVLAVFAGPHAYISASCYSNPRAPSTWNYMSVHVRGRIRFVRGQALVELLRNATAHFENENDASPALFDRLPGSLVSRLIRAIAGFEIEIASIEGIFKLSQDKDAASFANVVRSLESRGTDDARSLALAMKASRGVHESGAARNAGDTEGKLPDR